MTVSGGHALQTSPPVAFQFTGKGHERSEFVDTQEMTLPFASAISKRPAPRLIIDDEFPEVSRRDFSAVPDDLFSSEEQLRTSGTVRRRRRKRVEADEEDDELVRTVELKRKRGRGDDLSDSSAAEIEFILKEVEDRSSDGVDF
jgi:hypothetical protein